MGFARKKGGSKLEQITKTRSALENQNIEDCLESDRLRHFKFKVRQFLEIHQHITVSHLILCKTFY